MDRRRFLAAGLFRGRERRAQPGVAVGTVSDGNSRSAAGFVYHQGAVRGAFVAPIIAYFAVDQRMGFAMPMMIGTIGSLVVLVIAVFFGPETKGMIMTPELEVRTVEVPA